MTTFRVVTSKQTKAAPVSVPAAPATYSNADKARADEQTNKLNVYGSKTTTPNGLPLDNNEKVTLGQITTQLNDDITAISGGRRFDGNGSGGLQQPKVAK
jgi:hypothetical protein